MQNEDAFPPDRLYGGENPGGDVALAIQIKINADQSVILEGREVQPETGRTAESTSISLIAGWSQRAGQALEVHVEGPDGQTSRHMVDGTRSPYTLTPVVDQPPTPPPTRAPAYEEIEQDEPLTEQHADSMDFSSIKPLDIEVRGTAWKELVQDGDSRPDTQSKGRRRAPIIVASVSAAALLLAGGTWAITQSGDRNTEEQAVAEQIEQNGISLDSSVGSENLLGYSSEPAWESSIGENSALAVYETAMVEVTHDSIEISDPHTGSHIRSVGNENPSLDFLIETTIDGSPAIAWVVDDTLKAWTPKMEGKGKLLSVDLKGASISDSGSGILVVRDGAPFVVGPKGLEEVTTPEEGVIPLSYDQGNLVYSEWSGPIKTVTVEGEEVSSAQLAKPFDDAKISRWISAGHNMAVLAWESPSEGTFLVLHDIATGEIKSKVTADSTYLDTGKWIRGQGLETAVIGPLMLDLQSGELIADGSKANIIFDYAKGDVGVATAPSGNVLVHGRTAWSSSLNVAGVLEDGTAIVRVGKDRVISLNKEGSGEG